MRNYRSSIALAVLVFVSLTGGIADAREGGRGGEERFGGEHRGAPRVERHEGGPRWRGEDLDRWHGGHWFQGDHLGRLGWWWVVGDEWYNYATPVYPYPDPYAPPAVAAAPSAGYWYYCASANAYYPYVTQCPEAWKQVVPQP